MDAEYEWIMGRVYLCGVGWKAQDGVERDWEYYGGEARERRRKGSLGENRLEHTV